jgi:BirA family biotin operon repressor/biotin-[acetyl-CoA-carboxylase] ligase
MWLRNENCNNGKPACKKEYEDKLFRIKKPSTFKSNGAQVFSGFIEGVSLDGKLKLRLEDDIIKTYDLKEVELLY